MNVQDSSYGRVRPNPSPRFDSPRLGPLRPAMRRQHSRRNYALLALVACFLVLLAACSTTPSGPEVVGRPKFAPPRLTPPQLPEALPEPVKAQRTVWRHGSKTPNQSSA